MQLRRVMLWAPMASVLVLLVIFCLALFRAEDPVAGDPLIDQPLPEGLAMEAFESATGGFDPATVRGPYLLNVWASWCAPCRIEHPFLMELQSRGVPIYGVVYKDRPQAALGMLSELGNPFSGLVADPQGRVGIDLGLTGAPETLLVDERGIVRMRWRGAMTDIVWMQHFETRYTAAEARAAALSARQAVPVSG